MAVDIGGAMERGFDRVTTRQGMTLVAAFAAVGVAVGLVWETAIARLVRDSDVLFADLPPDVAEQFRAAWADFEVLLDLPVGIDGLIGIGIALWLVRLVLKIGAIRWFVGDATAELEAALFTRRLAWTLLNLIAGVILYGVAVLIGLVLLVVPGIFLAVALFFYNYEVIVEGENAIDALANSYALTAGDRLELFLLGLVFAALGTVVAVAGNPGVLPGRLLPVVVGASASAAFGVYGVATAADAYRQLRADDETDEGETADAPTGDEDETEHGTTDAPTG